MTMTFLELAELVLREAQQPLTPEDIWQIAQKKGYAALVGSKGKTPERTLGAKLYMDIRDNPNSLFAKADLRPTRFALKEFAEEKNLIGREMLIMYQEYQDEVAEALNILLETIENAIKKLNSDLGQAGKEGKYEQVEDCIKKAKQMTAFKERVEELKKEWDNIFADVVPQKTRSKKRTRHNKLKRGLITSQDEFFVPILQALVELGGSAPRENVLNKVEELMRKKLNTYDYETWPHNRNLTRWQRQAQLARATMINEKLLSSDSPKGVWEITNKGRRFLEQNK